MSILLFPPPPPVITKSTRTSLKRKDEYKDDHDVDEDVDEDGDIHGGDGDGDKKSEGGQEETELSAPEDSDGDIELNVEDEDTAEYSDEKEDAFGIPHTNTLAHDVGVRDAPILKRKRDDAYTEVTSERAEGSSRHPRIPSDDMLPLGHIIATARSLPMGCQF